MVSVDFDLVFVDGGVDIIICIGCKVGYVRDGKFFFLGGIDDCVCDGMFGFCFDCCYFCENIVMIKIFGYCDIC